MTDEKHSEATWDTLNKYRNATNSLHNLLDNAVAAIRELQYIDVEVRRALMYDEMPLAENIPLTSETRTLRRAQFIFNTERLLSKANGAPHIDLWKDCDKQYQERFIAMVEDECDMNTPPSKEARAVVFVALCEIARKYIL